MTNDLKFKAAAVQATVARGTGKTDALKALSALRRSQSPYWLYQADSRFAAGLHRLSKHFFHVECHVVSEHIVDGFRQLTGQSFYRHRAV